MKVVTRLLASTLLCGALGTFGCQVGEDGTYVEQGELAAANGLPSGETVVRWNANAFAVLLPTAPTFLTRELAMTHIAMSDAANLAQAKNEGYAVSGHVEGADPALAAAAAAHDVLAALRPGATATLDGFLSVDTARVNNANRRALSLQAGATAAQAILALRTGDGSASPIVYTPGTAAGEWRPTPPANAPFLTPHWGNVTPFSLTSAGQFMPDGPPALDTAAYTADYNEVKNYGSATSTVRSADETHAARFWVELVPIGVSRLTRTLATEEDLDLFETARVFALIEIAFADALIATWHDKLHYNFWRPITAIRLGDTDGNDDTAVDVAWNALNVTPPFPEYTSAHAVVATAGAVALTDVFGDDRGFTATSTTAVPAGSTRTYLNFDHFAQESTDSRVWGGFHFRTACEEGAVEGRLLGEQLVDNYFRRLE